MAVLGIESPSPILGFTPRPSNALRLLRDYESHASASSPLKERQNERARWSYCRGLPIFLFEPAVSLYR